MGPGNSFVVDFPIATAKLHHFFDLYKRFEIFILNRFSERGFTAFTATQRRRYSWQVSKFSEDPRGYRRIQLSIIATNNQGDSVLL